MSIATDGDESSKRESDKYKAIAIIEYMRGKEKIPEVGTHKSREPGSHIVEKKPVDPPAEGEGEPEVKPKTYDIECSPAFNDVRLTETETNEVYIELAEFLLDKSLCFLSLKCLDYVTDQGTTRVLFCLTKAKMLQLKYQEAAEDLHNLFTNIDPDLTDAYILFGHCKFLLGDHDEALDKYYKAIRISNIQKKKLQDNLLH